MPSAVWPRPEVTLVWMVGLKLQTGWRQHWSGLCTSVHSAGSSLYSGHLATQRQQQCIETTHPLTVATDPFSGHLATQRQQQCIETTHPLTVATHPLAVATHPLTVATHPLTVATHPLAVSTTT